MQSFSFRIFNLLVLITLASIVKAAAEPDAAPPVEVLGYRNYQPMAKRAVGINATTPTQVSTTTSSLTPLVWNPSFYSEVALQSESTPRSQFSASEYHDPLASMLVSKPTSSFGGSNVQSSLTPSTDFPTSSSTNSKISFTSSTSPSVSISTNVGSIFTLSSHLPASPSSNSEPSSAISSLIPTGRSPPSSAASSSVQISYSVGRSSTPSSFTPSSYPDAVAKSTIKGSDAASVSSLALSRESSINIPASAAASSPTLSSSSDTKSSSETSLTSSFLAPSTALSVPISSTSSSKIPLLVSSYHTAPTPSNMISLLDSTTSSEIPTTSNFKGSLTVSSSSALSELNDTKPTEQGSYIPFSSFHSSPTTLSTSSSEVEIYHLTPVISSSSYTSQAENHTVTSSTLADVSSEVPTVHSSVASPSKYPISSTLLSISENSTGSVYTIGLMQSQTGLSEAHSSSLSSSMSRPTDTPAIESSSSSFSKTVKESTLSGIVTTLRPSVVAPSNAYSEKSTLQHTHYSPSITASVIVVSQNRTWISGTHISPSTTSPSTFITLRSSSGVVSRTASGFNASSITTPVSRVTSETTLKTTTSLPLTLSSAAISYSSQFYNRTDTSSSSQSTDYLAFPVAETTQSDNPLTSNSYQTFPTDVNTDTNHLPSSLGATSSQFSISERTSRPELPRPTSEAQAPQWLPTNIFTATEPETTSSETVTTTHTELASPPHDVPKIISPPTTLPLPKGYTVITIGFNKKLNFPFLFSSPYAGSQIIEFLPKVLSYPFNIANVSVALIVPLESNSRDYLVSVAEVYFPSDKVDDLQKMLDNPSSLLYESYSGTGRQLASFIDPAIPLKGLVGKSLVSPPSSNNSKEGSAAANDTTHNIGGLDDFQGVQRNFAGEISRRAKTVVGVVVGGSCAAAVLVFLIFNYYYVQRNKNRILVDDHSIHSSSSGSLDNTLLRHQSYKEEKSLQPASMFGGGTRASVSPTLKIDNWMDYNDNYGRASQASKPSYVNGRITTISAPIASENSLGWDA